MSAQPTPARSMEHLALANERRVAIGALRAQIRVHEYPDGMRFVAGLLRNPSLPVESMRVADLLHNVQYMSDARVVKILTAAEIRTVGRRVRDLTPRQRNAVATELEQRSRAWRSRSR